jgi:hypothetical protein
VPPLRERRDEDRRTSPTSSCAKYSQRLQPGPCGRLTALSCARLFQRVRMAGQRPRSSRHESRAIGILQDEQLVTRELTRPRSCRTRSIAPRHEYADPPLDPRPPPRRVHAAATTRSDEPRETAPCGRTDRTPARGRRARSRAHGRSARSSPTRCDRSTGIAARRPAARRQLQTLPEQDQGNRARAATGTAIT